MKLTGKQFSAFEVALLSAYPTISSLTRMVRFELEEHLTQIAGGGNLTDIVFNLIIWAESKGRIRELIIKSHDYNPGNAQLSAFASQFSDPQPTSSLAPSNPSPAPPTQPMTTRQMRQHLKKYFDDPQLNELCMDYFPEVYNRFSVGMRKDSKITLLLDYCRRVDAREEQLQKALEE
jgi:hypothetical protein